ncbi:hypothetical protein SAY86_016064 [Trapa natans]|uniref:NAB domain-containing protein n=1 Tax=Trapa natans TaxID=22666 RepID=A0AAN7L8U7_TRANT|nr:hypothetical protein SAY86_016064 [Trapa natans]
MALAASSSVRPQQSAGRRVRPCVFEAEMSKEKSSYHSSSTPQAPRSKSNSPPAINAMPPWLLSTIADLEERVRSMEAVPSEEDHPLDTFAQRAESYYRKRPQLLSLLRDLYNAYVCLSDRYFRGVAKRNRVERSPYQVPIYNLSEPDDGEADSEAESSLSFQKSPPIPISYTAVDADMLVAELVMKNVEHDILLHEVKLMERRRGESWRKMDLQENLLEVLESERMILLSQNAALGHQVAALMEENQVLATESELMRSRAAELAKCIWKIREDGCVGELSCKIDDLKDRIFGLEKQNKEYYEEIVRREMRFIGDGESRDCSLLGLFAFQRWKLRAAGGKPIKDKNAGVGKKQALKWWAKVSKCVINHTPGLYRPK